MTLIKRVFLIVCIAGLCFGQTPAQNEAPLSFVNMVTVGDSLAAGFQSGVLRSEGQLASFPALIARQAGTYHFLPLMPAPGVGSEITLVGGVPTPGPTTGGAASRGFPLIVPQNLAIPGQDVGEALTVRPDLTSSSLSVAFPNLILGVPFTAVFGLPPVSQIELAVGLQPTFTLFWLGSNDVLGAALAGDSSLATPIEVFQQTFTMAVGAMLAFTNTRLVVANVPDVTVIPFLTPAEEVAALAGAPLAAIGPVLGIAAGDLVTANGVPLVGAILTGQAAGPLPANVVLTAAEVGELRLRVALMNGFINAVAAQLNFPVVDANGFLNEIDQNGIEVGGRQLTTDFLGGIFTLDGVHPTNTAHAITANRFIEAINGFYNPIRPIPLVDVAAVAARDPLVFAAPGGASTGVKVMPMSRSGGEMLKSIFGPRFSGSEEDSESGRDPQLEGYSMAEIERFFSDFPIYSFQPGPVFGSAGREADEADPARVRRKH